MPNVEVTFRFSQEDGYLAVYARFRPGRIHTTYEVASGVSADVDREGGVLGVEVIKTFSTKRKRVQLRGRIDLDKIQKAVERRFQTSFADEFEQIREAAAALA